MIFLWFPLAAQVLLSDWLSSKLQLVLETDEDDDPVFSPERRSPQVLANAQPAAMNYTNFDGNKQRGKQCSQSNKIDVHYYLIKSFFSLT